MLWKHYHGITKHLWALITLHFCCFLMIPFYHIKIKNACYCAEILIALCFELHLFWNFQVVIAFAECNIQHLCLLPVISKVTLHEFQAETMGSWVTLKNKIWMGPALQVWRWICTVNIWCSGIGKLGLHYQLQLTKLFDLSTNYILPLNLFPYQ